MKLALEISFYIFLVIALFGGFLLVWLFRWLYGEKDILSLFPQTKTLPQPALDEVKKLLRKIREQIPQVVPARREVLLRDLDLTDKTLQEVELRTENQQADYYQLCEEREKMWNSLKALVEQMSVREKIFSKKTNAAYLKQVNAYKKITARIAEAEEFARFQGELLFAEICKRGVYQRNVHWLYPSKKKKNGANSPEEEPAPTETSQEQQAQQSSAQTKPTPQQKTDAPSAQPGTAKRPQAASTQMKNKLLNIRPDLRQADFPKVGINVRRHKYVDATFRLDFEESGRLQHYDFEGTLFRDVQFLGVHEYHHCNFKQVNFTGATWPKATKPHRFRHCNFAKANLTDCLFEFAAFYECRFEQSLWTQLRLENVKFVSCLLDENSWHNVDLSHVLMSKDMLANLDFSQCTTLPQNHPDRLQTREEPPPEEQNPLPGRTTKPHLPQDSEQTSDRKEN